MKYFFLCLSLTIWHLYSTGQPVTCKDSSFGKAYTIGNDDAKAVHQLLLSDKSILLTGTHTPAGGSASLGLLMKLNAGGDLQYSRESAVAGSSNSLLWNMAIELNNKDIVLGGYSYKTYPEFTNTIILTKKTSALSSLWTRQYTLDAVLFGEETSFITASITEASNGDIILMSSFFVGVPVVPGNKFIEHMITRIDGTNGNVIWSKTFDPETQTIGFAFSIIAIPGAVVVLGYTEVEASATNVEPRSFYAMKLSLADGSVQLLKRFRYKQTLKYTGAWGNYFEQYKGSKIASGYQIYGEPLDATGADDRNLMLIQLDNDFNIINSKCWTLNYFLNAATETTMDPAGNISALFRVGASGKAYYSNYNLYDASYKRTRALKVPDNNNDIAGEVGVRIAFTGNDAVSLLLNYQGSGGPVMSLTKLIPADTLESCSGKEMKPSMQEQPFEFDPLILDWGTIYDDGIHASPAVVTDAVVNVTETEVCKVVVEDNRTVTLGNDAIKCNQDSLTLTATPGFDNYRWPDNYRLLPLAGGAARVSPDKDTFYIVEVAPYHGCLLRDTVDVTVLHSPAIALGNDTGFCAKQQVRLEAPNGFQSYHWNTGAATQAITATDAGSYIVNATYSNGCISSDTLVVNTIYPLPSHFIVSDTSYCSSGNMLLRPYSNFDNYTWSNGSHQSFLTINQPGNYAVTVTDNNGCMGKATTAVAARNCLNSIHIPTAFTPDGNGKNDFFGPIVNGWLAKYQLSIYNRWGECIFSSGNPAEKWNGLFKGQMQGMENYVWMCQYQFEGEIEKIEKGTILLIH